MRFHTAARVCPASRASASPLTGPAASQRTGCFEGKSFTRACDAGAPASTVEYTAGPLAKGEGVQVVAGYPAGTFVRLTKDVINLDAVYDKDLLSGNEYVAAFMEEGIGLISTSGEGVRIQVGLNYKGLSGGALVGVA